MSSSSSSDALIVKYKRLSPRALEPIMIGRLLRVYTCADVMVTDLGITIQVPTDLELAIPDEYIILDSYSDLQHYIGNHRCMIVTTPSSRSGSKITLSVHLTRVPEEVVVQCKVNQKPIIKMGTLVASIKLEKYTKEPETKTEEIF
jgi:hypothetical protein